MQNLQPLLKYPQESQGVIFDIHPIAQKVKQTVTVLLLYPVKINIHTYRVVQKVRTLAHCHTLVVQGFKLHGQCVHRDLQE